MFSTLLGPLPAIAIADIEATGIELLATGAAAGLRRRGTRRGWSTPGAPSPAPRSRPSSRSLPVPYSAGRDGGRDRPVELAERLRATIVALTEAGCPFVEIDEPDALAITVVPGERRASPTAHRRLVDGIDGRPRLARPQRRQPGRSRPGDLLRPRLRELRVRPDRRPRQLAAHRPGAGGPRDRLRRAGSGGRRRRDARAADVGRPLRRVHRRAGGSTGSGSPTPRRLGDARAGRRAPEAAPGRRRGDPRGHGPAGGGRGPRSAGVRRAAEPAGSRPSGRRPDAVSDRRR